MEPNTKVADSERKFAELILYISAKCESDPNFGATKLNKLLFFSDFEWYGKRQTTITGQEYQRLEKGPAPRRLLPVVAMLQSEKAFAWQSRIVGRYEQRRPVAIRASDVSVFTSEELAFVDGVIKEHWGETAAFISDESHRFVGWDITDPNETIPYSTSMVSNRPPTPRERDIGLSLQQQAREILGRGQ